MKAEGLAHDNEGLCKREEDIHYFLHSSVSDNKSFQTKLYLLYGKVDYNVIQCINVKEKSR